MRRKGTRGGSVSSPEKTATPRRSSRRGRKSPEVDADTGGEEVVQKSESSSENESDYGTEAKKRKKINRNTKARAVEEKTTPAKRGRGRSVKTIPEERASDIEETDENGESSQTVEVNENSVEISSDKIDEGKNIESTDETIRSENNEKTENDEQQTENENENKQTENDNDDNQNKDDSEVVTPKEDQAVATEENAPSIEKPAETVNDDSLEQIRVQQQSSPKQKNYVNLDSDVEMPDVENNPAQELPEPSASIQNNAEEIHVDNDVESAIIQTDDDKNSLEAKIVEVPIEKVEAEIVTEINLVTEKSKSPEKLEQIKSPKKHSSSTHKSHSRSRSHTPEPKKKITLSHKAREERPVSEARDDNKQKPSDDSKESEETKDYTDNKKSQPQLQRKRRWLSKKTSDSKPPILTISTDSLKNIIPDVQPVPLCDVKLESSPEPEVVRAKEKEENRQLQKQLAKEKLRKKLNEENERHNENRAKIERVAITKQKKLSTAGDDDNENENDNNVDEEDDDDELVQQAEKKKTQNSQTTPKNHVSSILYITNLVRPFTVLQLKGLLARTGKIVENGFWIDKIKSKCYIKYETEDEASETRHALNGVKWPTSNPKFLNVDFAFEEDMENAIMSTMSETPHRILTGAGQKTDKDFGWSKEIVRTESIEKLNPNRPVREWDVGKKDDLHNEKDRDKERDEKSSRSRPAEREREFGWDRKRGSKSPSPARKFKKKENDPPLRLLDDLFRKTKITPCIYWLPLTAEQISVKEEMRRKHMAEHQRRMEEIKKQERERSRERGGGAGGSSRRSDSRDRRRNSRDRRRYR